MIAGASASSVQLGPLPANLPVASTTDASIQPLQPDVADQHVKLPQPAVPLSYSASTSSQPHQPMPTHPCFAGVYPQQFPFNLMTPQTMQPAPCMQSPIQAAGHVPMQSPQAGMHCFSHLPQAAMYGNALHIHNDLPACPQQLLMQPTSWPMFPAAQSSMQLVGAMMPQMPSPSMFVPAPAVPGLMHPMAFHQAG